MQKDSHGLLNVEFDMIKNANLVINAILDKGRKATPISQTLQPLEKESI
jgi:hypothetical protein